MAVAFVLAVVPSPPVLPVSDKLQHAAAFLLLAGLGRWAYPETRKRTLLLGLAGFGAFIEVVQALPFVGRDSDPLDWVADVSAALAVFVIIALWPHSEKR
jgi:VanZ family protein